ncbi:MAG: uracil phosphoribosyltransferase [Verrucomicrobia bacterium]|jgi:uracil phosphoribosyltransferase|nr:uracil phosphoribosyltransferase [Verrucomicrobiota bacterium]
MLHLTDHPLIAHELRHLRDRDCGSPEFRTRLRRIASLMVPSVTADLETRAVSCTTPMEVTSGRVLARPVTLVPVLRAGLALMDGFLDMIPQASVAHIGLRRDESTLRPQSYYVNHPPEMATHDVIVLDPMLATGGSASEAIRMIVQAGAASVRFVCLVASPEGIAALESAFPCLPIHAAALDRCIDDRGFILPGLGDAGDRMFGTAG